jgi:hypothetical protein
MSRQEEKVEGAVEPHAENDATDEGNEDKPKAQSLLSHILPHLSIPLPSVPALSVLNRSADRGTTSDKKSECLEQRIDNALQKRARKVPVVRTQSRPTSQQTMNRTEISRIKSKYSDIMPRHVKMPNTRLQAIRDSFPTPSLPRFVFDEVPDPFECLNGQDVVLLGGYRGSILRDVQSHKRLWVPLMKAGLNIRKVDLSIPLDDGADDCTEETIYPDGMLSKMGPIDFSHKLILKFRALEKQGKCRLHIFGYDWRISSHLLSERFQKFLESLPSNNSPDLVRESGALVIAHSMGGLIAHHAFQKRPDLFYGVVYCGTPFQHCVNILGPFKRGDALLRNREILSTSVNFSMRSSFVFLPLSGECFTDRKTHERYLIDFFDYRTWLEYGLSPCVSNVGEPDPRLTHKRSFSPLSSLSRSTSPKQDAKDKIRESKEAVAQNDPTRLLEPHLEHPPPKGAKPPKLKHDREQAIEYLKRTLAETKKFKEELELQPSQIPLVHRPLAVLFADNTPTVSGAFVDDRDGIKTGYWWDFTYGPGDGVVLAKSAQLPEGFASAIKVQSNRVHIQLLSDLKAVGAAIEGVVNAKMVRER